MSEVLILLILTAVALALPGLILVLKNMAMVSDALSHTILLGIVLAYFVSHDLDSPWLVPAAALFGLFTVYVIDKLSEKGKLSEDAATGLVFPLFFSLAVLLISRFGRGAHLDLDQVIMGDVVFAPFHRMTLGSVTLPKATWSMLFTFLFNLTFFLLFYKEIKLSCFDPEMATLTNLWPKLLTQLFIFQISLSAVTAFEVVGAILVIAFLVIPAATALYLTKRFLPTILLTVALAVGEAALGFGLALELNVSIPGMIATVAGIGYFIVFFFRSDGYVAGRIRRRLQTIRIRHETLLLHIYQHRGTDEAVYELGFDTLPAHLSWSEAQVERVTGELCDKGLIEKDLARGRYQLTEKGEAACQSLMHQYGLHFD